MFRVYSYVASTDPADVARVESKTFLITENKYDSVPHVKPGVRGILGQWMSPEQFENEVGNRFPECMKGRHWSQSPSTDTIRHCRKCVPH